MKGKWVDFLGRRDLETQGNYFKNEKRLTFTICGKDPFYFHLLSCSNTFQWIIRPFGVLLPNLFLCLLFLTFIHSILPVTSRSTKCRCLCFDSSVVWSFFNWLVYILFLVNANHGAHVQVSTVMIGVHENPPTSWIYKLLSIVLGKIGQESAAARYAATTAAPDFSIESEKPYAEVSSRLLADHKQSPTSINSYGWARILPSLRKTSRPSGPSSIWSKTTKLCYPRRLARNMVENCHSFSRCFRSTKPSVFKRTRTRSSQRNSMLEILAIIQVNNKAQACGWLIVLWIY